MSHRKPTTYCLTATLLALSRGRRKSEFLLVVLALCGAALAQEDRAGRFENDYPLAAPGVASVVFTDSLWGPRLETNRKVSVPHGLKTLEATGVIGMFRTLNGSKDEPRYRKNPWGCSDAYKTFEGLARVQRTNPDKAAVKAAQKQTGEFLKLVGGAQADDGFIFPYLQLYKKDYVPFSAATSRYTETYSMGHLIEMAVEHFQTTGNREALIPAMRVVACIDASHGVGKKYDIPSGHPEIEIALVRLYRATGDPDCLRVAKYLIEKAKTVKTKWSNGRPALGHDEAVGHAVAMFYLYAGVVDVAQLTGDEALMQLMHRKWNDAALKKTYITGNCGHRSHHEGFSTAYDLPNDKAYCETCAAIAYVLWNHRMFLATGDAKYTNLMERTLYNAFLSGMSLSGDRFYYPNPLEISRTKARVPWFNCACCPTNAARFFPLIPSYLYSTNATAGDIYVNLFAANRAQFDLQGKQVTLTQKTEYPRDGKVSIAYQMIDKENSSEENAASDKGVSPRIRVRVPDWCNNPTWSVNGQSIRPKVEKGYAVFLCDKAEGTITLNCEMPVVRMVAHPKVEADRGRVALMRGPIVYCCEGIDSPELASTVPYASRYVLAKKPQFAVESKKVAGMEVDAIRAKDYRGRTLWAISYFARCYRDQTSMAVWLRQGGLETPPEDDWDKTLWKDALYRPLDPKTLGDAPPVPPREFSASSCNTTDSVEALGDGKLPKNSADYTVARHTWRPRRGSTEWLQCDFAPPKTIRASEVYWFDDTGTVDGAVRRSWTGRGVCAVPKSWRLLYLDASGKWQAVENRSSYGTDRDRFNRVEFAPVTTKAMRLEAKLQHRNSGGATEWRFETAK